MRFRWLNKDSREYLKRGYLKDGQSAEDRVVEIANTAEESLKIKNFSKKFIDYISKGWFSLSSPVWANYGAGRGMPISCLAGNSWINTLNEGGKQIKDIAIGDEVLTHKGRYKKVIDLQVRGSEDDLYELKVQTRLTPIKITGNHPVLTNLGWVRVDELEPNVHYIATNNKIEHESSDHYIHVDNYNTDGSKFSPNRLNESVKVDEDLAWALGLWFAEGSLSTYSKKPNGIRITMGLPYRDSAEKWFKIITSKFGINGNIYKSVVERNQKTSKWLSVNVNSTVLGRYFSSEFGLNCKVKNIPLWIKQLPLSLLKKFFEGFYLGDGKKRKDKHNSLTIANPKLAMSLYEIGLRCGYRMGLQMQEKAGKLSTTRYVYRVDIYCRQGKVNLSVNNARSGIEFSDGNRYCPFKIKKLDHNEPVYDLTVEEDHSFSVSGVIVHNCFGSYIEDSVESMAYTNAEIAMMSKYGGGTSAYLGAIRPRGSIISTGGKADGPVHYTLPIDSIIDTFKQADTRRGSCAVYLDIDHEDIEEFLKIKTEGNPIQNLQYGVCVSDEWMESMINGDSKKRKTWAKVIKNRMEIGFPYIFFTDNANKNKPKWFKDLSINASNLCVSGDQRVPTQYGILTAKELYEINKPISIFDNNKIRSASEMKLIEKDVDVYKITLDNGMTHTVTSYHKIKTKIGDIECKNLKIGDKIAIQTKKGLFGNKNRVTDAFLLGLYQSDGTQNKNTRYIDIWENDFDLIEEIEYCIDKIYKSRKYNKYQISNQFGKTGKFRERESPKFYECKVNQSKVKKKRLQSDKLFILDFNKGYIPDWIWTGCEYTHWAYIKGLLFADGTVFKSESKGEPIQISYADINKNFLQELQILFANLGIQTSIRLLRKGGEKLLPDGNGGKKLYNTQDCWRLIIGNKNDALKIEKNTGFLSRKGVYIEDRNYRDNTKKYYSINSIEYIGKEDVFCLKVNSKKHHWVCNGIITHNCTEIMLPTNELYSFVCCLSSLNLLHYDEWKDTDAVETLIFFLDSVMSEFIEKSEGKKFMERAYNFAKHYRSLGMGVLGWHSYLQSNMIPFESFKARMLNNQIFNNISEKARLASSKLASIFGEPLKMKSTGLRNATTMALAPTKSSSFILNKVSKVIEPESSNFFVKDLAKSKTVYKNPYLEEILIEKGRNYKYVWQDIMKNNGSVQHLDFLTSEEKEVFKTAREISQMEIIQQAATRQRYIDQGQSLNLFIHPSIPIKHINQLYIEAWKSGIKSLYYQFSENAAQSFARNILECKSCEG